MHTCRCCILLALFFFPGIVYRKGKTRPFFRVLIFREKWEEGSWVPMHLHKGDKSNLLLQREHTQGVLCVLGRRG